MVATNSKATKRVDGGRLIPGPRSHELLLGILIDRSRALVDLDDIREDIRIRWPLVEQRVLRDWRHGALTLAGISIRADRVDARQLLDELRTGRLLRTSGVRTLPVLIPDDRAVSI